MEAQTRLGERQRAGDDGIDDAKPAACSPLEESANALAGVEGAMGSTNAKSTPSTVSKRGNATIKSPTKKERSESIDQLISVAGSMLRDPTATAAAIAESNSIATAEQSHLYPSTSPLVPNPIILPQESTKPAPAPVIIPPRKIPPQAAAAAPPPASKPKPTPIKAKAKKKAESRKSQIQYNPDVPMTKEQLTSWRREMRRVRNRESAAASRRKVRDRIEELEEEVDIWKKRYEEAMERLGKAEEKKMGGGKSEGL